MGEPAREEAPPASPPANRTPPEPPDRGGAIASRSFAAAAVAAVGAVYGDLGTSPLYAWTELRRHGVLEDRAAVVGAASLVFWTLTLLAFGKYVGLVLGADNNGEGGTFALRSHVQSYARSGTGAVVAVLAFASALLYGEGLLMPAISVLSAVEGLRVRDPALGRFVVPTAVLVLSGLFLGLRRGWFWRGRRRSGAFGAAMVTWFLAIGALGAAQIVEHPEILRALAPHHALGFLVQVGPHQALVALGASVLCVTGAETLFADVGLVGARAIRTTSALLVYPALVLQYLGQGARLLSDAPLAGDNVFYALVPPPLVLPMVALATVATGIASLATISGVFTLTRSAINVGLLPRVTVVHTTRRVEGQVYVPVVNAALWVGCCVLVLGFGSSSNLAAAYGLSVVGTMLATSIAMSYVARFGWGWSPARAFAVFGAFGAVELAYLLANALKIPDGAWLPLAVGSALFAVMQVWKAGRRRLADAIARVDRLTVRQLLAHKARLPELPRAMVFLTAEHVASLEDRVPLVLLKFVDRYGALPRHLTLFSIATEWAHPHWRGKRFDVRQFGDNVTSVRMHVGYLESPDTRAALVTLKDERLIKLHATRWTLVMGREEILVEAGVGLAGLPTVLFSLLLSWGAQANQWFGLGADTGISKEVIPVLFRRSGVCEVVLRRPELDPGGPPRTPVPPSAVDEAPPEAVETEETSAHDIPHVTGSFRLLGSPVHATVPPEDGTG